MQLHQNPAPPEYRLGGASGASRCHWFRAKFFQQYRLFFRFHAASRLIIYGWVSDESCQRGCESTADAYKVFQQRIGNGSPPDDWNALIAQGRDAISPTPP